VKDSSDGGREMFFVDSGGGREMTLIAKMPLPSGGAAQLQEATQEPRLLSKKHVATREAQHSEHTRSVQVDQTQLMGIAQRVHSRLLNELQEAQALLAREQERTAEIAAQLSPERLQQLNAPFRSQRAPIRSAQTVDVATPVKSVAGSPQTAPRGQLSPLLSTVVSTKLRGIAPDPTRYRAAPRSDTRSAFAKGRGLDFSSGVTRTATWRLQNQWQGGLNWKDFQRGNSADDQALGPPEDSHSGSHATGRDIDGRIEAERVLRQRLADLGETRKEGRTENDHADAPQSRPGTSASRATRVSEAHVAGVRRARLQAYQECFDSLICRFDVYSPLVSRIKREFDALIHAFERSIDDVTARKVEPAAKQSDDLKLMQSSSTKRIEALLLELREVEEEAQKGMERFKHLQESNATHKTMVATRQIQSRRSDQDFTKRSLHNDTLTMTNFELKGVRSKQSSTRQQIDKNLTAMTELEREITRMNEEEDQLKQELDALSKEAQERRAGLRALVQEHCTHTGESWDVDDLERATIEAEDTKLMNQDIFAYVVEIGRLKSQGFRRMPSLMRSHSGQPQ